MPPNVIFVNASILWKDHLPAVLVMDISAPDGEDFGVFEVGMNHPGEIVPLVKMIRPHVALITTVEAVHLEFFDDVEQIAKAKAEIFEGLEPGGTAVLNADNAYFSLLKEHAEKAGTAHIISFGKSRS